MGLFTILTRLKRREQGCLMTNRRQMVKLENEIEISMEHERGSRKQMVAG